LAEKKKPTDLVVLGGDFPRGRKEAGKRREGRSEGQGEGAGGRTFVKKERGGGGETARGFKDIDALNFFPLVGSRKGFPLRGKRVNPNEGKGRGKSLSHHT